MADDRRLHLVSAHVALQIAVGKEYLRERLGDLVLELGPALARAVDDYARQEHLGYFPALDFFRDHAGLDPHLLRAAREMGDAVAAHVRAVAVETLWPVFSRVRVVRTQVAAFTMPRVSRSAPDALAELAIHYLPNRVRLELELSAFEKGAPAEGIERFFGTKAMRNLLDRFEAVEVVVTQRTEE